MNGRTVAWNNRGEVRVGATEPEIPTVAGYGPKALAVARRISEA
jgi:hypothetical protein